MKKILALSLLFIVTVFVIGCAKTANNPIEASVTENATQVALAKSPYWTLTDADGVNHTFPESEKGKTTIVLFWATWCPYCKSLMPHIQSALYEYEKDLDLQVFALSVFEDSDPSEYINESGYDFILFENADEVAKRHNVQGTPGLLVIDKEGYVRFDLRDAKTQHLKASGNKHWQKARKNAPYWAAELRSALEAMQ